MSRNHISTMGLIFENYFFCSLLICDIDTKSVTGGAVMDEKEGWVLQRVGMFLQPGRVVVYPG